MTTREFVDGATRMVGRAVFSDEDVPEYRYRLERRWSTEDDLTVLFVMLNPSTATEVVPDATITRCIRYAQLWGYDRLMVGNIFALRSTDPTLIRTHGDPVGPENDEYLIEMASQARIVICAWGTHGADPYWEPGGVVRRDRGDEIAKLLRGPAGGQLYCLGTTKDGHPRHPLYLSKAVRPERYGA